jgi:hypothetical protein
VKATGYLDRDGWRSTCLVAKQDSATRPDMSAGGGVMHLVLRPSLDCLSVMDNGFVVASSVVKLAVVSPYSG